MFEFNNKNLGKSYSSKNNAIDLKTQPESSGIEKTLLKIFLTKYYVGSDKDLTYVCMIHKNQ